eukprot:TRINITY_DN148_c0_g1_i5.p3 TRINITY_DN148_c0_g1~~TRINITY_DN148_c0_g1_i5.p3  ORF type:complete len:146 (-),score=31.20 TRINITY_DN148_c0_g1_i5:431-868(-)
MERAPSAAPVTPESGVGSLRRTQSDSARLIRRDCNMHDGRPPHAYYVDADTGVSYWEPLPAQTEAKTAAAATAPSSSTGASAKAGAACGVVAKPSTVGMWSPRGIVSAGGRCRRYRSMGSVPARRTPTLTGWRRPRRGTEQDKSL